jgi:hypothetical protein
MADDGVGMNGSASVRKYVPGDDIGSFLVENGYCAPLSYFLNGYLVGVAERGGEICGLVAAIDEGGAEKWTPVLVANDGDEEVIGKLKEFRDKERD